MLMLPHNPSSVDSLLDLYFAQPGTIHRILLTAIQEWSFFGGQTQFHRRSTRRGGRENQKGYYQRVGLYWHKALGMNLDGRDRDTPWSAAFISYVMLASGVDSHDFKGASAHSRYIHRAIQNRVQNLANAKFLGRRITEYAPKEGDLVCYSREGANMTYDKAIKRDSYTSHCDIVVYVRQGEIGVIGGNVSDSVTLKIVQVDARGFLTDRSHPWFAVLENRLPLS
jgi:hypothetical protein